MAEETVKPKKIGGCLKGILIFALAALLLVGAAAWYVGIPQMLGWVKPAGARFTDLTSERESAKEIVAEAESKGFKSNDVSVYVFPKPDSGDAVIVASYDFSKKVELSSYQTYHPVVAALVLLGGGKKAEELRITHVAVSFRDEQGKLVLEVAASTSDIRDLTAGKMTEADFKKKLGMRIDLPNYLNRVVNPF